MLMLEERANGKDCAGGIQPVCQPLCSEVRERRKEDCRPACSVGSQCLSQERQSWGEKCCQKKLYLCCFVPSTFLRGPRTHFWQKLFQGRWREKTIKRGSTRQIRFASSLVQSWHQEQKSSAEKQNTPLQRGREPVQSVWWTGTWHKPWRC